jgi:arginine/serine-rich splicing factor 4/5/6
MSSRDKNCQIFIAKLPHNATEKDLERKFDKYGEIKNLNLKQGYAFVEYKDYKDASYAIEKMDGRDWDGQKLKVQYSSIIVILISWKKKRQ